MIMKIYKLFPSPGELCPWQGQPGRNSGTIVFGLKDGEDG